MSPNCSGLRTTVPSHDKAFIGRDAKQPGRVASGQHCVILEASRRIFTGVSLRIKGHHVEIHGQLQIVESKARRRGITIKITKGLVFLPHSNFHDPRVYAPECVNKSTKVLAPLNTKD